MFAFDDSVPPPICTLSLQTLFRSIYLGAAPGVGKTFAMLSGVAAGPSGGRRSSWQRRDVRPSEDYLDAGRAPRLEEHTSELQSPDHLVCRLQPVRKNFSVI